MWVKSSFSAHTRTSAHFNQHICLHVYVLINARPCWGVATIMQPSIFLCSTQTRMFIYNWKARCKESKAIQKKVP